MKRLTILALVLCLFVGLAPSVQAETTQFPIVTDPITLKIVAKQTTNQIDFEDMIVWQRYEEMTGIDIEWTMVPSANFTERRNLMFATADLPDAVYRAGLSLTDATKYASEGLILSMSEYLDQCPNLSAFYERHPDVVNSITMSDGKIYTAGYYNECAALQISQRLFVNQKWLSNLGLKMPTTTEELQEVLVAFRDMDANGNGDAGDEIPFCTENIANTVAVFAGAYGLMNHGSKATYMDIDPATEDEMRFWPASDEYKQELAYLSNLYAEKLLDNECFTITYENFVANGTSDLIGVFPYVNVTLMGEMGNNYAGLEAALVGPNGDQLHTSVSTAVLGGPGAFVMCMPNQYPAETMRWLDFFYGVEGAEHLFMVEKGKIYETDENGKNYYVDYVANNPDGLTMSQVIGQYSSWSGGGSPAILLDNYFIGGETLPIPLAAAEALQPYMPEVVWETFSYTEEENEEMATLLNDITSYIEEMRAQFITGKASVENDWDAYLNELTKMGVEDYIAIQEAAYARYKG